MSASGLSRNWAGDGGIAIGTPQNTAGGGFPGCAGLPGTPLPCTVPGGLLTLALLPVMLDVMLPWRCWDTAPMACRDRFGGWQSGISLPCSGQRQSPNVTPIPRRRHPWHPHCLSPGLCRGHHVGFVWGQGMVPGCGMRLGGPWEQWCRGAELLHRPGGNLPGLPCYKYTMIKGECSGSSNP